MPVNGVKDNGNYIDPRVSNLVPPDRSRTTVDKTTIGMSDNGKSVELANMDYNPSLGTGGSLMTSIRHGVGLYDRTEIDIFNKTYRFGLFNPYGSISNTREYIFFTKPDLNIVARDEGSGRTIGSGLCFNKLNDALQPYPFWRDLFSNRKEIIRALQDSYSINSDRFNHLLQNQVNSNLDIPSLSSEPIQTAENMYGVSLSYRGSSENEDDNFDFSLEFKDSRWLHVYYYFKAYEEYETLKHHGIVRPYKRYIEQKIIHDQISVYKFLVDEDGERILYYGKYYGVMPVSLPRDVFSSSTFDNGITYSISFKAAFYEDMRPEILADFNDVSYDFYSSLPYQIDVYNDNLDKADMRPAKAAYVYKEPSTISPTGYDYKLKWRGSDTY